MPSLTPASETKFLSRTQDFSTAKRREIIKGEKK
jgi:hypothetical protein